MKTFYKISSLLLMLSMVAVSCGKKELVYEAGEAEDTNCMGVYFPAQAVAGNHEVDPADPTQVTILVSRTNSVGDATVPYVISATCDGEPVEDVFTADEMVFKDGQTETSITLKYPEAKVGIPYSCSIRVTEKAYAAIYGQGVPEITYSFTRVKWNDLGKGKMREDFLTSVLGSYVSSANPVWDVTFFERDDQPGLYRIYNAYDEDNIVAWLGDDYKAYHDGAIPGFYFILDARDPKKVWIPYVSLGWQFYSNGIFYIGSLVPENVAACPDMDGYASAANYGSVDATGLITFPERSQCYGFAAEEWWGRANTSSMLYFAPPGVTPVDYSLSLKSSLTEEGVSPISITAGVDVDFIKYAVYDGELTAKEVTKAATALAADEKAKSFNDLALNAKGTAKTGTLGLSAEKTGVYTVIALSYDKDKKVHNTASTAFTYVLATDPVPVVLSCGLEVTGKYAPQGYTTENSLEFYVYGKNITDAKVAAIKYLDIAAKGYEACVAAVKAAKSVSADNLKLINGNGYVDVATGLVPGTQYYLFVWATNGYEENVFVSDPATTEGDPLPIYMDYSTADYYEAGAFANAAAAIGTWNYYGTDVYGTLGMRELLGKVTITASETATEGPDDSGLYDEYVNVTGLFGDLSWLAKYEMPTAATVEMDVYGGIMYHFAETVKEENYLIYLGAKERDEWGYAVSYASAFIPVADGYYAFVDCSKYAASYNFCGIGLADPDAGWIAKIWDPLLVAPEKDTNTVAAASVSNAKALMKEIVTKHDNFVETDKGRMMSIIDEYNKAVKISFTPAGIRAEREPKEAKGVTVRSIDWIPSISVMSGEPVAPAKSR